MPSSTAHDTSDAVPVATDQRLVEVCIASLPSVVKCYCCPVCTTEWAIKKPSPYMSANYVFQE